MTKDPTRVAAGKRAKAKGASWQRDVAKMLTEWSGETWKATPRSGGLRWGGTFWTYGDLTPPVDFPLVVECKHYHEVDLLEVLGTNRKDPGLGLVVGWYYDELLVDVARADEELGEPVSGILVWKQDRCRPRLSIDLRLFNTIGVYTLVTVTAGIPGRSPFVTVDLQSFLDNVSYSRFKAVA